jgi:hypothetical protein
MNISQMIEKLQMLKDKYGDATIYVRQKFPHKSGMPALNSIGGHTRFQVTYENGKREEILWFWAKDDEQESDGAYVQVNK